jgi:hypothetical protein
MFTPNRFVGIFVTATMDLRCKSIHGDKHWQSHYFVRDYGAMDTLISGGEPRKVEEVRHPTQDGGIRAAKPEPLRRGYPRDPQEIVPPDHQDKLSKVIVELRNPVCLRHHEDDGKAMLGDYKVGRPWRHRIYQSISMILASMT